MQLCSPPLLWLGAAVWFARVCCSSASETGEALSEACSSEARLYLYYYTVTLQTLMTLGLEETDPPDAHRLCCL